MNNKISFDEFMNYVEENLLEGWRTNCMIRTEKVTKNNGMEFTGLLLLKEGEDFSPTMYLEDAYEHYCFGENLNHTLEWMRDFFEYAEASASVIDIDILDYESMSDKIVYRLVNYEKNKELLEDCPFLRLHDLAITFRLICGCNGIAVSSSKIDNELMETWGIDMETLLLKADENTCRIFPAVLRSLGQCFEEESERNFTMDEMFVLGNEQMMGGASVILYEGLLDAIAEDLESSYYVLPSSIHEMILIPECWIIHSGALLEMVKEANENVVDEVDFLSDSVYYYNRDQRELSVIASCS